MTTTKKKPVRKVPEIPAACPNCGCTERTKKQKVVVREIAGELPNGQKYTHVENYRATCKECGQRLAFNRYVKKKSG